MPNLPILVKGSQNVKTDTLSEHVVARSTFHSDALAHFNDLKISVEEKEQKKKDN
jgi:hypothetical protein